ncbi:unnamed protein product [Calypogeia fissa]
MKSSKSAPQHNSIATTVCDLSDDDYLENEHVEDSKAGIAVLRSRLGNARKQSIIYLDGDLAKRKYEDMTSSRIEDVESGENDDEVSGKFSYFREHKKRRPPEALNPMLQFIQDGSTTSQAAAQQVEGVQQGEVEHQAITPSEAATPDVCGESDLTAENQIMAEESSRSSNNDHGSSMFESAAESAVSRGPNAEFRSVSSLGVNNMMHCFMEHTNGGGGRETVGGAQVSATSSAAGPAAAAGQQIMMSSLLLKNHHDHARNIMMNEREHQGVQPRSEPAASYQLGSGSSEAPGSSVANNIVEPSQLWGRSNQETWLQLGVGSPGRGTPAGTSKNHGHSNEEGGQPSTLRHGHDLDRTQIFKRKITSSSIDFPAAAAAAADGAADCEANSNSMIFQQAAAEHSNASPGGEHWQFSLRGATTVSNGIPPKLEAVYSPSDLSVNLNPATFRSIPISRVMGNSGASEVVEVEKPDLCIFGRRLIQRGTARQELVLAPISCSGTTESCSTASEKDHTLRAVVQNIDHHNNSFELRSRDQLQEGFHGGTFLDRDHFGNYACLRGGPEILHKHSGRAGPVSLSTPITDFNYLRSAAPSTSMVDRDTFQTCHRDHSPPSSLSALQQRREDLRHHGQTVAYSWLPPPPAADSTAAPPKLIPTANNFQGWTSSESAASNTKLAVAASSSSPNHNHAARMVDNPMSNQQAMRSQMDESSWGNLFKKVSPKMLFQSPCLNRSEGSSVNMAHHETNAAGGSQENLVALKRAIENIQKGPPPGGQWPSIPPEAVNLSIASWCLNNGNLQSVSRSGDHSKQEHCGTLNFAPGDRERIMASNSNLLESSSSAGLHSRFAAAAGTVDHLNLSGGEKSSSLQRQSWQPAAAAAQGGQSTKLHHHHHHHGNIVNALHRPVLETAGKPRFQMLPPTARGPNHHTGLWFVLQSAETQNAEGGLPQISKAYLRIKDGKMPVSAVKKYLVTKLGLSSESEVEITCKGQPVVPSLPLQHVRDVIWFSSLNGSDDKEEQGPGQGPFSAAGEREESATSASEQRSRLPAAASGGMFSKDILMVLTYRRHPRSLQLSTLMT